MSGLVKVQFHKVSFSEGKVSYSFVWWRHGNAEHCTAKAMYNNRQLMKGEIMTRKDNAAVSLFEEFEAGELDIKRVKIVTMTKMLGTVAKDPKVFETFIGVKKPPEITENEAEFIDDPINDCIGYSGFHRDDNGLFIYEYMLKGMLKDAGNVLKDIIGVKALKSKITNFVFVAPRRLCLNRQDADGVLVRPLRAPTPQGERVAITRSDFIEAGLELEFYVGILKHKEITADKIHRILRHGRLMGLGQWRNAGYGRFKVLEFEDYE